MRSMDNDSSDTFSNSSESAASSPKMPILLKDVPVSSHLTLPKNFLRLLLVFLLAAIFACVLLVLYHQAENPNEPLSPDMKLILGILNSLIGSLLSASGYCAQKWSHLHSPPHIAVLKRPIFLLGLTFLALGTISAVVNLGLLGQTVQAPFAALTLIYNALLAHMILQEVYTKHDFISSSLILTGVAISVGGALGNEEIQEAYSASRLVSLYFERSVVPVLYTIIMLTFIIMLNRFIEKQSAQKTAIGLLCYSFSGGVTAGFTSLVVKSAVEIFKHAIKTDTNDFAHPMPYLCVMLIPTSLVPQLYFMNKGLEHFGTLKFVPMYQSFIILANLMCGVVYFNELAAYSLMSVLIFFGGCSLTLFGVSVLLAKVEDTSYATAILAESHYLNVAKWLGDEDDIQVLTDFEQCQHSIIRLLKTAKSTIYYSTFLCDFDHKMEDSMGEKVTMMELIHDAARRNVEVHLLYNPISDYGTSNVEDLCNRLPQNVIIHSSVSDHEPGAITKHLSNNSKYAFHHQKYICIDGNVPNEGKIMVTGCDVNSERGGWLEKNRLGYFWHELGVVANCPKETFEYIASQHNVLTKYMFDDAMVPAPFPLVNGGWIEENLMVEMITTAKYSIQLENQIFISGGNWQENRIAQAIVHRICRGLEDGDDFHALVLTNAAQQDEPSFFTRKYCEISLTYTIGGMEALALSRGFTLDQFYSRIFIGRLEHNGILVKVHSNILIQDGHRAIRTSSNLADRSLSHRPCDTELGIMIEGRVVAHLQTDLLEMYVGDKTTTIKNIVRNLKASMQYGNIHPIQLADWSTTWAAFCLSFFVLMSEGATGGRYQVTFSTKCQPR